MFIEFEDHSFRSQPMVTKLIICVAILIQISGAKRSLKFRMPAEWEPHEAVWFGWEQYSVQYHPVVANLIKALIPHVEIKVAVSSDSLLQTAKNYLRQQQVDISKLKFYLMPGERYWIRDHGATFLLSDKGELGAADFDWDRNGYREWLAFKYDNNKDSIQKYWKLRENSIRLTSKVDSLMASVENAAIMKTAIIHEGGGIEVNGKGTLILCEATILSRNPGRTKQEIEKECMRLLGVSKVVWLKKGLAEDPLSKGGRMITGKYVSAWGTGGHTDEFVRFANPNTILLAWVNEEEKDANPLNQMNWERMNENFRILEKSTDQDGKAFKIIKVPLPDLIVKKIVIRENVSVDTSLDLMPTTFKTSEAPKVGDTLLRVAASSYLNYLVTNGIVVLPSYQNTNSSKVKEDKIRKIFRDQFPDRKQVFIDAMPQNWDGGGIHCSTQQQPKRKY